MEGDGPSGTLGGQTDRQTEEHMRMSGARLGHTYELQMQSGTQLAHTHSRQHWHSCDYVWT